MGRAEKTRAEKTITRKKGSKCDRYHPRLCLSSLNQGWCDKEKCTFHHLPGTGWSPPNWPLEGKSEWETYANAAKRSRKPNTRAPQRITVHRAEAFPSGVRPQRVEAFPSGVKPQRVEAFPSGVKPQRVEAFTHESPNREEHHQHPNFQDLFMKIQQMELQLTRILQRNGAPHAPEGRGCNHCFSPHQ